MSENEPEVQHQKSSCAWASNKIRKLSWIAEWTRRHSHSITLQHKTLSKRSCSSRLRGLSQTPASRVTTAPSLHMVRLGLARLTRFRVQPRWCTGKRHYLEHRTQMRLCMTSGASCSAHLSTCLTAWSKKNSKQSKAE